MKFHENVYINKYQSFYNSFIKVDLAGRALVLRRDNCRLEKKEFSIFGQNLTILNIVPEMEEKKEAGGAGLKLHEAQDLGSFNDYVDIILLLDDHLLTSAWTFCTLRVDKKRPPIPLILRSF